jgi:prepilin signal peptidase PulO-like enzyme (type II secretory pathway)
MLIINEFIVKNGIQNFMVFLVLFSALLIIWFDFRYKAIPLYLLTVFGILSFLCLFKMGQPLYLCCLRTLSLSFFIWIVGQLYLIITGKFAFGSADIFLFGSAGAWLDVEAWPCFFILTGGLGLITGLYYTAKQQETFPFSPAILTALLTLIFLRLSL